VIVHGRSSSVLRRAFIVAVAALVPAVAGCEAGANAPTLQWHPPTGGASATLTSGSTGQIAIRNVFVLGAPVASSLPAGHSAGMFLALVNTGPRDRLLSISAPGTATSVRLPKHGIVLPDDESVLLTGPVPRVILDNLTRSLGGGEAIPVVLNFQNAGSVTLQVPVMPKSQYYGSFSPAPVTPTATPTRSRRASASASPTATPSASTTP
jgi:copper(I)-binding protein